MKKPFINLKKIKIYIFPNSLFYQITYFIEKFSYKFLHTINKTIDIIIYQKSFRFLDPLKRLWACLSLKKEDV